MKTVSRIAYLVFTAVMCFFFVSGVWHFFTVPAAAKAEAEEIERMLRKNQEEAEERLRQAREKAMQEQQEKLEGLPKGKKLYELYRDASQMNVTGIGDSVMLAALPQLYEQFPNGSVDAVFGRTLFEGRPRVYQMEADDAFGDAIVYSLITNSYVEESDIEDIIDHSCGRPTFWITTYGVANDSNAKMRRVAARRDDAYIIEWEDLAMKHREWILGDGLHPNETGSRAYAKLICDTITKELLKGPVYPGDMRPTIE